MVRISDALWRPYRQKRLVHTLPLKRLSLPAIAKGGRKAHSPCFKTIFQHIRIMQTPSGLEAWQQDAHLVRYDSIARPQPLQLLGIFRGGKCVPQGATKFRRRAVGVDDLAIDPEQCPLPRKRILDTAPTATDPTLLLIVESEPEEIAKSGERAFGRVG